MTESTNNNASLYERLGGWGVVNRASDSFYEKIITDPRVNYFFENVDMVVQNNKMKLFFAHIFGGIPVKEGFSLRKTHVPLVEKGLNDSHFDIICEKMAEALRENDVDAALVTQVLEAFEKLRPEILNR